MTKTELVWQERASDLELIASVWTCNASEITSRTVLADPCVSILLVRSSNTAEVIIRGAETTPREEILLPGYVWTAIRLQPGVQLKGLPAQQLANDFKIIQSDSDGRFQFEGVSLWFPSFNNAERLIEQMQAADLISGTAVDDGHKQRLSSKSYSRLIKRTTGLSPYKLRQLQRIHKALRLLKQGIPAAVVASELGFADQAHLSRAAKQFFGHTPKELLRLPQQH